MEILLNPATARAVKSFAANPGHAVLLEAPAGMGKYFVAQHIAHQLLHSTNAYDPNIIHIAPEKNAISIADIRQLQTMLKLKSVYQTADTNRVVIVEDMAAMTIEAQNAFLKILEEPPASTVIIGTVTHHAAVLTTINSRAQHLTIQPPSYAQVQAYYQAQDTTAKQLESAYHISGGRMGLLQALLTDNDDHPLVAAIALAKTFLQKTAYERLTMLDEISGDRDKLVVFLDALSRIAQAALHSAAKGNKPAALKRWHHINQLLYDSQASMSATPQAKLLLTHLSLNL